MLDIKEKRHITIVGKGGGGQAESVDWNDIQNKPEFAAVATSGDYDDLNDKPTILTQWFGTQAEYDEIVTKDPNVIYNIEGSDNVQVDWNQSDSSADDYIKNKPTIPAAQVNSDWNATSGVAQILNKPTLATVATTGSYNDLSDKPTVTQEQADWNQTDTTAVDYIKNKPEIPSVPAMATEELTFTLQGGTIKTIEFYTVPNYFYVEDVSGSDNTLSIAKNNKYAPTIEVFSSTDKVNWTSIGTTSTTAITATIPSNGKLYLKANTNNWASSNDVNIITASGTHNVGGNIMSLLYGDDFENKTGFLTEKAIFNSLFANNNKLINANKLILPATTLTQSCYGYMFANCTSLTQTPVLPATTLAYYCYEGMFQNCRSLATAPVLPATTLVTSCYQSMFQGCTSLTTAPVLPATTLTQGCYQNMFTNCTSLTQTPALPATTLSMFCYHSMFQGCTNLNKVTTYATDISEYNCLFNWVQNVAATGDFYNLGGATYEIGTNGIPTGWTEHTSL